MPGVLMKLFYALCFLLLLPLYVVFFGWAILSERLSVRRSRARLQKR